ncbi:MAG: hypothetical protein KAZ18_05500 [Acinetobacter sp.]|nr:hypothetical protein [Acinetobacter sp.]
MAQVFDTRKCHPQPEQAKAIKALAQRKMPFLRSVTSHLGKTKVGRTVGLSYHLMRVR